MITFKTTEDDRVDYTPGDVFNIRPRNSEDDINDLFDIFHSHNIDIKPHYRLLVEECHDGKCSVKELFKILLKREAFYNWQHSFYVCQTKIAFCYCIAPSSIKYFLQ